MHQSEEGRRLHRRTPAPHLHQLTFLARFPLPQLGPNLI